MKRSPFAGPAKRALAAVLLGFFCGAACGADEPEAVYAKFHRAAMGGDIEEMLKYGPAARRKEMAGLSASSKEAALRMARLMMPRAYKVIGKKAARDGQSLRLFASGPGESPATGKLQTMYGAISMVQEGGEWKVDETAWSTEAPEDLPQAGGAAPRAAEKAASKPVPKPAPAQPLGAAKTECVYKPVMTKEDIDRCR